MKLNAIAFCLSASLLTTGLRAQAIKPPPLPLPPPTHAALGTERVDGKLLKIVQAIPPTGLAKLSTAQRGNSLARTKSLRGKLRGDDKVFVQIVGPVDRSLEHDIDSKQLAALGVEIGQITKGSLAAPKAAVHVPLTRTKNQTEAWLPLAAIPAMETLLPKGWRVTLITPMETDEVVGQGPNRMNTTTYQTAGTNGTGVTIAVIDSGFEGLTLARNNGDAPAAAEINLTTDLVFEGGGTHGTGCVEAAFDHAPGATWRLYRVDSPADYNAVITDCIANHVKIISHSLSWYNGGWGDDTGPACTEAKRAAENGMLFFTSCGNRAQSHYEGVFNDPDNDGFHDFAPGDPYLNITVGTGAEAGGSHYLSWSNTSRDYDLRLYNTAGILVVSSDTVGNGVFEEFSFTNTGVPATFWLAVFNRGGTSTSFIEIFSHESATWNEYAVPIGSNTSPSNTTHPGVIAVGAVAQGNYGGAAGTNVIVGYSSRGPSNSGMTLPDLCGPTDTTGFTYPLGFGGTSSATPNAAGAAAAFWSADLNLDAAGVAWLLTTQARLFRDWGSPGVDNTYGTGGMRLINHRAGTRWLARDYPGTLDNGTVPFHTVQAAHLQVPNGGRLLIFGDTFGAFPEPVQLGNLGKGFVIEAVPNSSVARVGQ